MKAGKRSKAVKAAAAPSPAQIKAGKVRRLANAIDAVLGNPDTVRMSPLWSCVENEEDKRRLSPADAQNYAAEEETLDQARARRKELKAAFEAGRLDLQEDEAVFLERSISSLPFAWVDAWTHYDDLPDETRSELHDLVRRFRFRADSGSKEGISGDRNYQTKGGAMTHKLAKAPHLYRDLAKNWKAHAPGCETTKKKLAELVLGGVKGVPARSSRDRELLHNVTVRDITEWARRKWPRLKASQFKPRTNA